MGMYEGGHQRVRSRVAIPPLELTEITIPYPVRWNDNGHVSYVVSTFTGTPPMCIQVLRRYNDFVRLQAQLEELCPPQLVVPELPERYTFAALFDNKFSRRLVNR